MSLLPERAVPPSEAGLGSTHSGLVKQRVYSHHTRQPTPTGGYGGLWIEKNGTSRQSTMSAGSSTLHGGLDKEQHIIIDEHTRLLNGDKTPPPDPDEQVALLIYRLFTQPHSAYHQHPTTIPALAPMKRGKRHRNPYIWTLNQFRHWWKSSRLLVRLSGVFGYCMDPLKWALMASLNVLRRKDMRQAVKQVKRIGQGGPNRLFLQDVHPFTRTIRIILALARAWEARVDNRFYEVGIAEGMAFMGNRCFRFWSRRVAEGIARYITLPLSGRFIAPYIDQQSRPVIVVMGLLRATLPFMMSFQGSRFGRQVTFAVYRAAHYRWKPVQGIFNFHEASGAYQELDRDVVLLALAREVAVAIGHGENPASVRSRLRSLGFEIVGTGKGGHSYYRRPEPSSEGWIKLRVTPYGPALLTEMPRYIVVERCIQYFAGRLADETDAAILDSAIPSDAKVEGFTYSGAFFSSQEWAALKERFEREYDWYNNACKIMGTPRSHIDSTKLQHNEIAFPPTDLITMKTFIRTGHPYTRRRKKTRRWNQIQAEVRRMTSLVEKLQSQGRAPRGVILYLEGLDCAGKSSTGGLIFDALEASGYDVNMVQYNRPPTDEEKKRPWMDRFQMPPVDPQESGKVKYSAILWDRGPAGDFVYGNLHQLSDEARVARYEEFMAFDEECRRRRILFCKLLFVADRDSIAETLGKRLSHKRIARDLHTWLDANSSPQEREGLDEIETHIDPSDFVAFNKYDCNLARFCEFVRNTNGVDEHINPWLVVSTYKRHPARLALLKGFERQLMEFAKLLDHPTPAKSVFALPEEIRYKPGGLISPLSSVTDQTRRPLPSGIVEAQEHGISMKAVLLSFLLAFLAYSYANQTLHFSIEDIT